MVQSEMGFITYRVRSGSKNQMTKEEVDPGEDLQG